MTPEEAKDLVEIEFDAFDNYCDSNHCSVIDMIYFDFKSRTCENCTWANDLKNGTYICGNSTCQDMNELGQYVTLKGFGCNKWEQKQ
jgi:hypothetical protein